ncbi:MAG TPA: bi-domain-containing oxidoreductase [Anaerolineaceae bacterium]|nr:bi-domain-containing oxidoreductase [Anaerolineaceae bacterium]
MKQLLQYIRDGKTIIADVPAPLVRPGTALIQTAVSLVSAGTERMVVEFAEKNLLDKARSRPDLVRQILDKAGREGILPTIEATFNRLDQPMTLGYSSAGTVMAVGEGLKGFNINDRVACAGGGYAVHAEYAIVPQNLLAVLPPQVDFELASFATLGAIAMHGFRLAHPQIGERVAIIGMGLLGLLAANIVRAAGCPLLGIDLNAGRVQMAKQMGFECILPGEADSTGRVFTHGRGFDIVLICADTHTNDPIELAGVLARDRGQVVAVGAVGLNIPRKIYYEKEINFQVSRSYGPGRYDSNYEDKGLDYPLGFVRWTEGRNLEAFVELLANHQVNVKPLITHRFPIDQAPAAYDLITGKTREPFLGVLITYPQKELDRSNERIENSSIANDPSHTKTGQLVLGVLGAGNYASAMFLPTVKKIGGISLKGIASGSGLTARHASQRYGFAYASSSDEEIINDSEINVIAVLTRHHLHARQIIASLQRGKHVFCEKPLAINKAELSEIASALSVQSAPILMVGFNRRYAPMAIQLKEFMSGVKEPFVAQYRINAGYIPLNHWLQDPNQGGGRIIGEGCHFVDLLTFLAGACPVTVSAQAIPDEGRYCQDNVCLTLSFPNGSIGSILYLANGDKSVPKERLEIFCGGQVGILDDFRSLELVKNGNRKIYRSNLSQDKGHRNAWQTFLNAVKNGNPAPIPYEQLFGVTQTTFLAKEALTSHEQVMIPVFCK